MHCTDLARLNDLPERIYTISFVWWTLFLVVTIIVKYKFRAQNSPLVLGRVGKKRRQAVWFALTASSCSLVHLA